MNPAVYDFLTQQEGYEIHELLGQGDFAEVYRALNKWKAAVVLKISREPCLANLTKEDLAWQEATGAFGICWNPHLANVYSLINVHDYLVMEVAAVDGHNVLAELKRRQAEGQRGLPPEAALRWMADVAEALEVLHAHYITHGHLSPDKMYVTEQGIIVIDGGLGELKRWYFRHGGPPLAWEFLPPGVLELEELRPAVDVYSWAACYVFLRTGNPPRQTVPPSTSSERPEPSLPEGLEDWETPTLLRALRLTGEEDPVPGPLHWWGQLARRYKAVIAKRQGISRVRRLVLPPGLITQATFDRLRPGGILQLKKGTYLLTQSVNLWQPVEIRGPKDGKAEIRFVQPRDRIEFIAEGRFSLQHICFNSPRLREGSLVSIRSGEAQIEACEFSGPKDGGVGLEVGGNANVSLSQCWSHDFEIGAWVACVGSVTIQESLFVDNALFGIELSGRCRARVERNRVLASGQQGIYIGQNADAFVWANVCTHNGDCGIACLDGCRVRLVENRCFGNTGSGIIILSARYAEIIYNTLVRNRFGLLLQDCPIGIAYGNKCRQNDAFGIGFNCRSSWVIERNICSNNKEGGIQGEGADTREPAANKASTAPKKFSWRLASIIRGNRCFRNQGPGILLTGLGSFGVIGNLAKQNAGPGIRLEGSAAAYVVGNRIFLNTGNGLEAVDNSFPILLVNRCRDNHGWGILVTGSARGQAMRNLCQGNRRGGICLVTNASSVLTGNICRNNEGEGCLVGKRAKAVLFQNRFEANSVGVKLTQAARTSLIANRFHNNRQYALEAIDQASGFLGWNTFTGSGFADLAIPDDPSLWRMVDNVWEKRSPSESNGTQEDCS